MSESAARRVAIIGIGDDGYSSLTESARKRIESADVLIGSPRSLAAAPDGPARKEPIGSDLADAAKRIEALRADHQIVLLASGDPLFYGVARYLCDRIGKDAFEVVPHVSSMQLAFARVMESWDEAYLTDVAQHPMEDVVDRIRSAEKVGLFTSEQHTPGVIAGALLAEGIDYFRVYVCENLGARNEVVTRGSLTEIEGMQFGPLNVMILVRSPNTPDKARAIASRQLFGNPDEVFRQSRPKRGLLTPAEVRTLALAELNIRPTSVIWDVGAGSGSVSIESAMLAREGQVFAVEPDVEDGALIRDNAAVFEVKNVTVIAARAPEAFEGLPDPDGIFVGGMGRETVGILTTAYNRLKPGGRLVVNVASVENFSDATGTLKHLANGVTVLMVNLARGFSQLDSIRFEAQNPSFLVRVQKPR